MAQQTEESGWECLVCGNDVSDGDETCPSCGADLTAEDDGEEDAPAETDRIERKDAKTMQCINAECRETLEAGAEFCPFCGAEQAVTVVREPSVYPAAAPVTTVAPRVSRTTTVAAEVPSRDGVLEMRAGQGIWAFTEGEGNIVPGQRRPLLIMDEQSVHLSHTDRQLTPEDLIARVQSIIAAQEVPVEVRLMKARWVNDSREVRSRIVAFLRGHPYSDIKMIMGVDYMGRWASIQLNLATEPEALSAPPTAPTIETPMGPVVTMIAGVLFVLIGLVSSSPGVVLIGFMAAIGGLIWLLIARSNQQQKHAAERFRWENEKRQREFERTAERLSRTFKVDDMRLFCTAMRHIFQAVVDDIVSTGGEVVRVEGGKGGFFGSDGSAQAPAQRRADAAATGV